jgi:hypothetical protein
MYSLVLHRRKTLRHKRLWMLCLSVAVCCNPAANAAAEDPSTLTATPTEAKAWPAINAAAKPWTYWYWMGGAVEESELTRHLELYQQAGLGGVHIVPIYGVRGVEQKYVPFLSPRWMELLTHTVDQANQFGLGVDMTTGTGWPFGGPEVQPSDAAKRFVLENFTPNSQLQFDEAIVPQNKELTGASLVVLMGYGPDGKSIDLTDKVDAAGRLDWHAPQPGWKVTALFQAPTRLPVERAAPGGEGLTIDFFNRQSLDHYLQRFDKAFDNFTKLRVRSMYSDSYENWGENWTPQLLDEFQRRRGYDLRAHLQQLDPSDTSDEARRVRADYRETMADLLRKEFTTTWTDWAHQRSMQCRNHGHGSPGNPLDLYALADIPETEVFGTGWLEAVGLEPLEGVPPQFGGEPEVLVCKLASSAAHVRGRQLCASETCTWLGDHFKIPLEHMKAQCDLMFVMGINHIFFHGAAYSPSDAPWPGWLWYATTDLGVFMPAWRDMPALCDYIARCQSWLQSGSTDNDVLVYMPIYDMWASDEGARNLMQYPIVHSTPVWLEKLMRGFAETGHKLWTRGYTFDFISDLQIANLTVADGQLVSHGATYQTLVIPACNFMPEKTLNELARLIESGATVIVSEQLPRDVPGLGNLPDRRAQFQNTLQSLHKLQRETDQSTRSADVGRLLIGSDLEKLLDRAGVSREPMVDAGLKFVRRRDADGEFYFIVNHSGHRLDEWIPVTAPAEEIVLFDPASGQSGKAAIRCKADTVECFVQLDQRQSLIVRTRRTPADGPKWNYLREQESVTLAVPWQVEFIEGGPNLPKEASVTDLSDWTNWQDDGPALQAFAGVARYATEFDLPEPATDHWKLDLGEVCHSATVRLNGKTVGKLISAPFQVDVTHALRKGSNRLEIEVANLPANRAADLDRRGVDWKKFYFVNIWYEPFDASQWKPVPSGLLGPVKLISQRTLNSDELKNLD